VIGGTGYSTLSDLHSDVTATFSPASGTSSLEGSATYSPYGTVIGGGWMPGLGYEQDYTDPSTGQVDMNARWYDPSTGSFAAGDTATGSPLSTSIDGSNYGYAGNNPLTNTDPTGQNWITGAADDVGSALSRTWDSVTRLPADIGEVPWEALPDIGEIGVGAYYDYGYAQRIAEGLVQGPLDLISELEGCAAGCGYDPGTGGSSGVQPSPCCGEPPILGLEPGWGSPRPLGKRCRPRPCVRAYTRPCGYVACPPPPPPQDCYAGPDPTCTVPHAPGSLLHDPVITHHVTNITSYADLCKQGDCITETNKSRQGVVKGTTPSNTTISSNASNGDQNDTHLLQPARDQGVQPTPAAGSADNGQGGGGNAGGGAPACVPDDNGQNPLSNPGALREAAVQVHNLATPAIRFNMSTVALAEVESPGGYLDYYASASGGILSPEQVALLQELGVPQENILTTQSLHAEMNIVSSMLPEGSTITRWGIAWGSRDNPNPCSKCAPYVNGTIEGAEGESC
jgi:RHS repeat-associated protein